MDALKRSLASEKQAPPAAAKTKGKKPKKAAAGQREMLLPISGEARQGDAAKETAKEAPKKAEKPVRISRPHQEGRMIGQRRAIASSSARCPGRPRSMTRYRFTAEAGS